MPDVQRKLPRYKCHKVVHALKISACEVHQDDSTTIAPVEPGYAAFKTKPGWASRFNGDDEDPGYYVVYRDGYESWSPSDAFEEGYTKLE